MSKVEAKIYRDEKYMTRVRGDGTNATVPSNIFNLLLYSQFGAKREENFIANV